MWETMYQLEILCYQVKLPLPGMGYICWVIGRKRHMESPKHQRLLPSLLVTLHKRMVRSSCWRYLQISLNTKKLNWWLARLLTTIDQCSWKHSVCYWRTKTIIFIAQLQFSQQQWLTCKIYWSSNITNVIRSTKHFLLTVRPTPWDRTYSWHCWHGQEPETR